MKAIRTLCFVVISSLGAYAQADGTIVELLDEARILSNCSAEAPVFCQDMENVKISSAVKKTFEDRAKDLEAAKAYGESLKQELEQVRVEANKAKDSDLIKYSETYLPKLTELEMRVQSTEQKVYSLSKKPRKNPIVNLADVGRYLGKGFGPYAYYEVYFWNERPLFKVTKVDSQRMIVEIIDQENGEISEKMVATCRNVITRDTVLGVSIPGTGIEGTRCELPNSRGYLKFSKIRY